MSMNKLKVLILQNQISSYNVELYNMLSEECDLTIGHYDVDQSIGKSHFKKHFFKPTRLGPFIFLKGVRKYAKQFDVVSIMCDLHVFDYWSLPFFPHNYKIVNWGIGFRVSYTHPYDVDRKHNFLDWAEKKVMKSCDASIFYMEKAKEFWRNDKDFDMTRVFVAPNTTNVVPIDIIPEKKKEFLFVGTLYKGKGLDILLSSYKTFISQSNNKIPLSIVGKGEERENLERYVKDNDLEQYVSFLGPIYDEDKLAQCFAKALLCFSPNQAGLSVPKSMGYGVPFVTRKNAITGGEIFHITPNENGFMYDKDEDLLDIMLSAADNPDRFVEMGMKAKEYYDNNATVSHRVKAVMKAISFTFE